MYSCFLVNTTRRSQAVKAAYQEFHQEQKKVASAIKAIFFLGGMSLFLAAAIYEKPSKFGITDSQHKLKIVSALTYKGIGYLIYGGYRFEQERIFLETTPDEIAEAVEKAMRMMSMFRIK